MPRPPKAILIASAVLGMIVVATAAFRIVQGAVASPPFVYMIGFEAIAAVAGAFAVLLARGRFHEGAGITLLCVSGVVVVASVVSYSTSLGRPLYDLRMLRDPFTAARLLVAALIGLLAALTVLSRRPGLSVRALAWGVLWTALALAIAAPALLPQARPLVASLHPILRMMGAVIGFVLFCAFFSAGVHFLIRAFQAGRAEALTNAMLPPDQPRSCAACDYPAAHGRNTCSECGANLLVPGAVVSGRPQTAPRHAAAGVA